MSGLRVNYHKTTVYRIGSIKDSDAKFYSANKIKWTNDPINVLGFWISNESKEVFDKNFEPLIQKMKTVLELWHHRGLSLFGENFSPKLTGSIASLLQIRFVL